MKLYIKNMVCIRCKMIVEAQLEKLGIVHGDVELGEVTIYEEVPAEKLGLLRVALIGFGLELMNDERKALIQKIKNVIIELVHYSNEPLRVNFSSYLSEKLHHHYTYLAELFSEFQGATIASFIIFHKIERVKELLVYEGLKLTEIAYMMHYSSVSHLSAQFKKVTGLTPTHFKEIKTKMELGPGEV